MRFPFVWRKDYEKLVEECSRLRNYYEEDCKLKRIFESEKEQLQQTANRAMDEVDLLRARLSALAASVSDFHPSAPRPVKSPPSLGQRITEQFEKQGLFGTEAAR